MTENSPIPPQKSEVVKTTLFKPSFYGGRLTRKQYLKYIIIMTLVSLIVFLPSALYKADLAKEKALLELQQSVQAGYAQEQMLVKQQLEEIRNRVGYVTPGMEDAIRMNVRATHAHRNLNPNTSWIAAAQRNYYDRKIRNAMIFDTIIYSLLCLFIYWPMSAKRAHDIGQKATIVITIGSIGLIVNLLYAFVGGVILTVASGLISLAGLVYGCILLFKDSQKGTNKYGPSTKYPDTTE